MNMGFRASSLRIANSRVKVLVWPSVRLQKKPRLLDGGVGPL